MHNQSVCICDMHKWLFVLSVILVVCMHSVLVSQDCLSNIKHKHCS
jgi:hypothetical protein